MSTNSSSRPDTTTTDGPTVPATGTGARVPAAPPDLAGALKSLLVDWFPVRDRLCDLRGKHDQTDREAEEVYQLLSELVDIADDIVAELVPDVDARVAITGEILP